MLKEKIIKIWEQCARFHTKRQNLSDQDRTIINKGWFSYLEIQEIHQKIDWKSKQQDTNTIINQNKEESKPHSPKPQRKKKHSHKKSQVFPDPKRPLKRNLQKLLTHNMPTEYVQNTNGTNKIGNLPFTVKLLTRPRGRERMLQKDQKNTRATIN